MWSQRLWAIAIVVYLVPELNGLQSWTENRGNVFHLAKCICQRTLAEVETPDGGPSRCLQETSQLLQVLPRHHSILWLGGTVPVGCVAAEVGDNATNSQYPLAAEIPEQLNISFVGVTQQAYNRCGRLLEPETNEIWRYLNNLTLFAQTNRDGGGLGSQSKSGERSARSDARPFRNQRSTTDHAVNPGV